jgi:hypothetical protein
LLPSQGVAVALPIYFATKRYLFSHLKINGGSLYFTAAFRLNPVMNITKDLQQQKILLKNVKNISVQIPVMSSLHISLCCVQINNSNLLWMVEYTAKSETIVLRKDLQW